MNVGFVVSVSDTLVTIKDNDPSSDLQLTVEPPKGRTIRRDDIGRYIKLYLKYAERRHQILG